MTAKDQSPFDTYRLKYHDLSQAHTVKKEHSSHAILKVLLLSAFVVFFVLLGLVVPKFINHQTESVAASIYSPIANRVAPRVFQTEQLFPAKNREVIGFLPSWSIAKQDPVRVVDLTQIIYFGIATTAQGELVKYNDANEEVLEWTYLNSDYFKQIQKQAKSSNTKVLVAIKLFDNTEIDQLISSQTATNRFITQLIALIKDYQLDGINLDFEYFTDTDYPTSIHLNRFLDSLTAQLKTTYPKLIISFDVNAGVVLTDNAYDMVKIGASVDQVILMAYDYYRIDSSHSGPVAPLYAKENQHSIDRSVKSLAGRVPEDKVILGIPLYGYEWQTVSSNEYSSIVPDSGALATYKRIDDLISSRDDIKFYWDEIANSPWLSYNQSGAIKQIHYEDAQSLQKKVDYTLTNNLGGIALWALGYDGNSDALWKSISRSELQKKPRP